MCASDFRTSENLAYHSSASECQLRVREFEDRVSWLAAACFGAIGGFVVSLVAFFNDVWAWHEERRRCLRRGTPMPRLTVFIDFKADPLVLVTRMIAGALTGYLVHNEVTGAMAVIAAGASAPAILSQFGKNPAYGPGLEVGTTDSERDRTQPRQRHEDPATRVSSPATTNYEPRHAQGGSAPSAGSDLVPRPRVEPGGSPLSTTETS